MRSILLTFNKDYVRLDVWRIQPAAIESHIDYYGVALKDNKISIETGVHYIEAKSVCIRLWKEA